MFATYSLCKNTDNIKLAFLLLQSVFQFHLSDIQFPCDESVVLYLKWDCQDKTRQTDD